MSYQDFLDSKALAVPSGGIDILPEHVNPMLFPFQRDLVRWSARKGRAALFADTGLGKTFMQLEWARLIKRQALIVAPLSVARQTLGEAAKLGIEVGSSRDGRASGKITITNYEMLEHFSPGDFGAVVLDESSILKSIDGKTRARLTDMFRQTEYKLCCTATPAPNDIAEIANHAEFLGIMTRADMLATFFVHDDRGWRLKKHAEEPFYRWLASWGMSVRKPSDLGYPDDGYDLPPLEIKPLFVDTGFVPQDRIFWTGLKGIQDRAAVRRGTLRERVEAAAALVNGDAAQWIVWCGLNDEGRELYQGIPGSVLVEGEQSPMDKAAALEGFQDGRYRVLITKPQIAGFGMNFQHAHNMAFVGLSDSWEMYYQSIRRCYRFGQRHPVTAYVILSRAEEAIYENITRKEAQAALMSERLVENVRQFQRADIENAHADWAYETETVKGRDYTLMLGDSTERLSEVATAGVDLSVFSPPFLSLYTYSPTERDVGNSRTEDEFYTHFRFIVEELLRVTKPGRNCAVHVAQVPAMLARDGYIGLKDFRGGVIRLFEEVGWVYHGEVCIDKDPQAQAIRTKSKALLFTQLRKDSSWSRPALADYILIFRKPGENAIPVKPSITNDEWIEWARPIWYGIRESDTLNAAAGRDSNDERHIAPLQLGTIERVIKLWSNPGETILSPFAGIGSEGYMALKTERKFLGIELKRSYFDAAKRNLERAHAEKGQTDLLDMLEEG